MIAVNYVLNCSFYASAQRSVAGGILFLSCSSVRQSVRPCVRPSVHPSMHPPTHPHTRNIVKLLTRYLVQYLIHFHQTYNNDALWD